MPTPIESQPKPRAAHLPRAALTALTALAFAALFALLGSGSVPCAFAEVLHLPCPGCGSTRAVHALLRGDLASALRYNALGPVLAALVLAFGVVATVAVARDGSVARLLTRALLVVAVLEIAVWIARFLGALGGPVPV
jgi:hypothetical protein